MMNIGTIFASLQKGFLKNVLTGAGLTLGTASISLVAFKTAFNHFKNSVNSVSADILGLAALGGFDIFFSLIIGAMVTRMTMSDGRLFLKKLGG